MKKLTIALALILCLLLCVFAFASCKKDNEGEGTTGEGTTGEGTTGGDPAAHVHTWAETYTEDTPATCTGAGTESIHCTDPTCDAIKPDSERSIPMLDHTWVDGKYTTLKEATCTEEGSEGIVCEMCKKAVKPDSTRPIAMIAHVYDEGDENYVIDKAATCVEAGSKSYHCKVCKNIVPGTAVPIDINPDAHKVTVWTDEKIPHLLDQADGYQDGTCSLCSNPVHVVLHYAPITFTSTNRQGDCYIAEGVNDDGDPIDVGGTFAVSKTIKEIRGDKHFFPTTEDPDGNDLWFEYSILWNETLANTADARLSAAGLRSWAGNCEIYGFYTRNDVALNEFAGHFDINKTFAYGSKSMDPAFKLGAVWSSYMDPAWSCILGPKTDGVPNYKGSTDKEAATAASYPAIDYGWHRIGFRFHQEAVASTTENPNTAAQKDGLRAYYTGYSELYIDGVKVWKVETSFRGYWNTTEEKWSGQSYALIPNRAGLFFANGKGTNDGEFEGAIEYQGVNYVDFDKVTVNMSIANVAGATDPFYVVVDDVHWTCGDGFYRKVERVENPEESLYTLDDKGTPDTSDDVTCSGKIFFKLEVVHVHTPDSEYSIDWDETCTVDGQKSYHCSTCGQIVPGTEVVIPATGVHVVTAWTEEKIPNLLDQGEGYRDGTCTLCGGPVHEVLAAWQPNVFCSSDPQGDYYDAESGTFTVSKTIKAIRGNKHFFPTAEDTDGNDLWFEYSILWNETLANTANARISAASFSDREIYGFYTRDDAEANEFGGHFDLNKTFVYGSTKVDGPTWSSYTDPAWNCVYALDNGQPQYKGSMTSEATAADYPAIGNYGWHRIGFHFHEAAVANTTENPDPAAAKDGLKAHYTGYSELYIDGVKVWKVEASFRGYYNAEENKWYFNGLATNRMGLFFANGKGTTTGEFAGAIEYQGVYCVDFDNVTVNMSIANVAGATNPFYVAIDDVYWTCGDGFVRNVVPETSPVATTINLGGTDYPSTIYFKLAD